MINLSFSQSLKAIYQLEKLGATKENTFVELKEPPTIYKYTFSKRISQYEIASLQETKIDSSINVIGNNEVYTKNINYLPTKDYLFKNFESLFFIKEFKISDKLFSIKDNLINYNWKLIDETKEINGFICKKAITTDIYKINLTAWYCEDIPSNDGPDRYWGLPGLIFQVENGLSSRITLKKIDIFKEVIEIKDPSNNSKFLTINEFNIEFNEFMQQMRTKD